LTRFIKTRGETKKKPKAAKNLKGQNTGNHSDNNLDMVKENKRKSGSDKTMCKGGLCPFKEKCHRFTANYDDTYQSWFTDPPFKIENGKPSCEMFWGEAVDQLFVTICEIIKGSGVKNKRRI